jgi:hypothetical protein
MTQDITTFLDRIPAIDRCAEVVKADGRMPAIYDVRLPAFVFSNTILTNRSIGLGKHLQSPADVLSEDRDPV